ncbi:hypothetical protein AVEN_59600-1 [Araneus ventricosus]|uniref:Uncharacterized protein n=1 Tax=Araneus ventricosus TaxID=182803 RepID=A0A4Y1ZS06_ARAVE|nr:hypothetical protein AVEN_59600-1 [Araneus ventricosus]
MRSFLSNVFYQVNNRMKEFCPFFGDEFPTKGSENWHTESRHFFPRTRGIFHSPGETPIQKKTFPFSLSTSNLKLKPQTLCFHCMLYCFITKIEKINAPPQSTLIHPSLEEHLSKNLTSHEGNEICKMLYLKCRNVSPKLIWSATKNVGEK